MSVFSEAGPYAAGKQGGVAWDLFCGDAREVLRTLPAVSVNTVVTSPAYYWQRDYEVDGQFGQEPAIDGYVAHLVETFAEVRRVLTGDGTLWLNMGDTYYSAKGRPHGTDGKHRKRRMTALRAVDGPGLGLPRKSTIGIPWRVALALQAAGWVLRSPVVWERRTAVPEPTARDRPWRSYEFVFLFTKEPRYFFDRAGLAGEEDVWHIEPDRRTPARGLHYAPFPRALVKRCLDVGCPPGGTVLDPFAGGGTALYEALETGRPAVGIDLSPVFCDFMAGELTRRSD